MTSAKCTVIDANHRNLGVPITARTETAADLKEIAAADQGQNQRTPDSVADLKLPKGHQFLGLPEPALRLRRRQRLRHACHTSAAPCGEYRQCGAARAAGPQRSLPKLPPVNSGTQDTGGFACNVTARVAFEAA